jgi:peptidoglycan hydrolase-like protein with peptidoglycan-binding domain
MANSAKRRKAKPVDDSLLQQGAAAVGTFVSQNPVLVGGSTAFLVTLLYVSANALWYQPHAHTGPLFATRSFETFVDPQRQKEQQKERSQPQTTIHIERPAPEVRRPLADPAIEKVQAILKDLNFYSGPVDGLQGPNTQQAIRTYQERMGLEVSGEISTELLEQLGATETTGAIAPVPTPRDAKPAAPDNAATAKKNDLVAKIQGGLRAFGNKDIEVDGLMGARTRAAIKEFQALFGLPETGEADAAVYEKMVEAKLAR